MSCDICGRGSKAMQIKLTIDECLEFADEWAKGCTFHEGSQGWRVVCMLLAEEVRRRQTPDENGHLADGENECA